ncbi:MAG TPA: peptidylprolyl isomerase [Flavipsychrobacter sp.]|nr:peptidylprolyl isomerase [Flavipsychrobacter sp.]
MSVIQKIRNKYAKVAGFVIALSLVGFILMDASNGPLGSLFGRDNSVAKVNGEAIDIKAYSQKVKEYETLYSYSQKGRAIDDATRAQVNQQALADLVNAELVKAECEKLGIQTTAEEAKELIYGMNADPIVRQYQWFQNPDTKMFDPQRIKAFEQQAAQVDPTGKLLEEWETIKNYVLQNNALKKYTMLTAKAVYLPKYMIDKSRKEKSEYAGIDFVRIPYAAIEDNQVPVKDDELVEYMKKNEKRFYNADKSRSIEYVSFDLVPSAEDTASALGVLNQIKNEFTNTVDVESIVNRNSDEQYNPSYINKGSFFSPYADSIFKLSTGSVYGPYFENNSYKLTKVVDRKNLPDSVKCRHILIKTEEGGQPIAADSIIKKRIDSVELAIKSGAAFSEMVTKYSQDDGSKQTGGEYTFTLQQKNQLSKEFGDFIFDGKAGEKKIVKVSNSSYGGYHYIEILEQKGIQPALKLATISRLLEPGQTTNNNSYAKAAEFAGKNTTEKAFDDATKKENISKRVADGIKETDFMVNGLGNSRELVRWLYNANKGDVSSVFTLNGRYIVAKMTGEQLPGLMKLDANNRPAIEMAVRNEKKAKMLAEKYKSLSSLQAISTSSNQAIARADSFNASQPFINKLGYEPRLLGYVFSGKLQPNTVSPAIKGQDALFYVSLVNKYAVPVAANAEQDFQEKMMMMMQLRNSVMGNVQETLKKSAKIKYNVENL